MVWHIIRANILVIVNVILTDREEGEVWIFFGTTPLMEPMELR